MFRTVKEEEGGTSGGGDRGGTRTKSGGAKQFGDQREGSGG